MKPRRGDKQRQGDAMEKPLEVAILEPYHGGSHAVFVETFAVLSRHRCRLATLPARKWKWRMRGAAAWFAREDCSWMHADDGRPVDVILCNDMLSVTDLRSLLPTAMRSVPIVCYFHENQLTYPVPDEQERDYQYGMTNILSCLAADAVVFNSAYHREAFLSAADKLLRKMPDHVPAGLVEEIRRRAQVSPPPVDVDVCARSPKPPGEPPTILWCHRWEFDKNPEPFFEALIQLDAEGQAFNLVLAGEQFRKAPSIFQEAWPRLERHIVHAGYLPDRGDYLKLLRRCDLVVSSAIQENFGVAVAEAILSGCQPLLPDRLAYPELIPPELHDACLYSNDNALSHRLRGLLGRHGWLDRAAMQALQTAAYARYGGESATRSLDVILERAAIVPR